MSSHLYLTKSNNDFISHCNCEDVLIAYPGQMDCPWCGCGWLFSCGECRKAFTFATCIETDVPWEELARRDIISYRKNNPKDPDADEIQIWIEGMQSLLEGIEPGVEYVWFDGVVVPTDVAGLEYEGWYASHNLDFIPQKLALQDDAVSKDILENPEYWRSRRVEN